MWHGSIMEIRKFSNQANDVLQLRDPKVRKMAELLEKSNSSYYPSFKSMRSDVVFGRLILLFIQ